MYHTHAIITRGLYIFYPLFEAHLCTLALCMVSIQERFLNKSGLQWVLHFTIRAAEGVPKAKFTKLRTVGLDL